MDFKRKKPVWPEPGVTAETDKLLPPAEPEVEGSEPEPALPTGETVVESKRETGSGADRFAGTMLARSRHMLNLYGGLVIGFLLFYALADYTAYTTAEQRPGQLIFSNTMNQLWTACFRMAFVLGASLSLLRLFWPELFRFFRSDSASDPDMTTTIQYELTSFQRLCVFLLAFFGLCYLFIMLLSVNLPETISVGR